MGTRAVSGKFVKRKSTMIRPVRISDAPAIRDIYNYYVRFTCVTAEEEDVTVSEMERRITEVTKKFPWLVNVEGDEVIGYAYLNHYIARSAYRFAVSDSIYVKHGLTGNDAGSQLMAAILDEARKMGKHSVMALMERGNEASEALHGKFGFREIGHLKEAGFKFNRCIDVSYWQLIL
ncbi:MAG: GNAT family N-acetyltransferase [Spirochaetaceae bacterium]|jgi:phosphinothricin acetyltransferase|nr:GNAT family N-acetyltransferase [Spirochaetaceae bacterium]